MFVVVAMVIVIVIMIMNVHGVTVVTVPVERRFQGITVFFVVGVTGVYGMETLIPLLVVIIL